MTKTVNKATKKEEINVGKTIRQSEDTSQIKNANGILIENHLGLLARIARKYSQKYKLDFDDLFQEGYFGLQKAADEFDPTKGYKLSSFAYRVVENRIRDFIRKERRNIERTMSLDGEAEREEDDIPLIEKLEDTDAKKAIDEIIQKEERAERDKQTQEILNKLKPKEGDVLQKKSETTYKKLSRLLHVSPERVRQIKKKALRKARYISAEETTKQLADMGVDPKEIERILRSNGILYEQEFLVQEKIAGPDELMRKIQQDCTKESDDQALRILSLAIQGTYDQIKELKIRGNHIVWPYKTKARREDIFKAVTILKALFQEKAGSPQWDLIEQILYPYREEVFKGGNIESWYSKRKKGDFKDWAINGEEREKFILENFRKEFSEGENNQNS